MYRNLSLKDKNQLVSQIEYFLNEWVTPLIKIILWTETKFQVPSKYLMNFKKKEFQR